MDIRDITRRYLFKRAGAGLGSIALGSLLNQTAARAGVRTDPLAPRRPMRPARAKSVIWLHMAGAPSQLDLWDWKPRLQALTGKPCPRELLEGKRFAFIRGVPNLLGTMFKFARHGQSGAEISELLPHFSKVVDRVALVKSMTTDEFNHAPAQLYMVTGTQRFGGAGIGAWATYGLGSENADLPGYVVLLSGGKTPDGGKSLWGSGFLPSIYQGVQCRTSGDPVLYVSDPRGLDRAGRRETLDALRALNDMQARDVGDAETLTRIAQYELAFRMQASVPDVMDISKEPKHVLDMYGAVPGYRSDVEGADDPRTLYKGNDAFFANNCLLARRLVERGVRFVQLFDWGWDHHGISPGESIDQTLPIKAQQIDRAMTALLTDLEQRGLLDSTLVVWAGEFGRTPMQQNSSKQPYIGRDHNPQAFTVWLAGGGVKGGQTIGETDDLGYSVARDPVHVHDLQATVLHLLGLDPYRLAYPFQGLDQRLIGPENKPRVVKELVG